MSPAPLLAALLAAGPAFGFSGTRHAELTRKVATDGGYDAAAAGEVVDGNLLTDKDTAGGEWYNPEAHFDSEKLEAGSARLNRLIELVVDDLDDCRPAAARVKVGRVLHGVQDFFSHSNWVENHPPEDPLPILALTDPDPSLACDKSAHKGGLTTGYFSYDKPPKPPPAGKCDHADLNKDESDRPNFRLAYDRAAVESKTILMLIDQKVYAKYRPTGRPQAIYRVKLLKDTSPEFEQQRKWCTPRPMEPPQKAELPKSAVSPSW